MPAFYNEIDGYAAAWLRNLAAAGHLPAGTVDERSIIDLRPDDIAGFRQCHFFAGIGGWPFALRLAGWPDEREVWTGSCPCQPLSSAGQRRGHADERHLWPAFYDLIAECRPATVFGEQVASKDGREWLAGVRADLEHLGYAVGAADLSAAGVGAPHIRQRLFWVADRAGSRRDAEGRASKALPQPGAIKRPDGRGDAGGLADATSARERQFAGSQSGEAGPEPQSGHPVITLRSGGCGATGGLADASDAIGRSLGEHRDDGRDGPDGGRQEAHGEPGTRGEVRGLEDAPGQRCEGRADTGKQQRAQAGGLFPGGPSEPSGLGDAREQRFQVERRERRVSFGEGGSLAGETAVGADAWSCAVWLPCLDGKARRVEPGIFPLADGVSARVGRLRAYGNAIVPQAAAEFIKAFLEK